MKKIYLVRTFHLFRNISKQNWNKLWKRWKYQAPFLVFWNTETKDYIGLGTIQSYYYIHSFIFGEFHFIFMKIHQIIPKS